MREAWSEPIARFELARPRFSVIHARALALWTSAPFFQTGLRLPLNRESSGQGSRRGRQYSDSHFSHRPRTSCQTRPCRAARRNIPVLPAGHPPPPPPCPAPHHLPSLRPPPPILSP